jgi:hypothetical protein
MYVQLDLPQVIVDVTFGLPEDQLKDCLSHIALTGTLKSSLLFEDFTEL